MIKKQPGRTVNNKPQMSFILYLLTSSAFSQEKNIDISGTWECAGSTVYTNGVTEISNSTYDFTTSDGVHYKFTASGTRVQTAPEGSIFDATETNLLTVSTSGAGEAVLNGSELSWKIEADGSDKYGLVKSERGVDRVSKNKIKFGSVSGNPFIRKSSGSCTR